MIKFKKISLLLYTFFVLATLVFISFLHNQTDSISPYNEDLNYDQQFIHGEIIKTIPTGDTDIYLDVIANSGTEKGETLRVISSSLNNYNDYQINDEILIYKGINPITEETTYEVADYYHPSGLLYIFILFTLVTIAIARKKGITSIVSILVSLSLFYFIFLKMIAIGYSPILACLIFVFAVTILTIPLIHGFNKKSLSAIIAIIIGYIISMCISFLFKDLAQLGIAPNEDFRILGAIYPKISLSDLLIASLFMGAIGALIDTTISIASAVFEAIKEHANYSFKKVYKIGMEVGKDILGSMINTLLFAYLASILPFLTLISLDRGSTLGLLNMDFIALELTRTFIGAISLVILIPIVASISAYFLTRFKKL